MAFDKRPAKKDFQKETIKIFRAVPDEDSRGNEIAVIRWITDGMAAAPQLVVQEVYTDRLTKKRMYGKVKGLKWGDYKFLTENPERTAEILDLLMDLGPGKNKRTAPPSGQEAAANDFAERGAFQSDEEVPF